MLLPPPLNAVLGLRYPSRDGDAFERDEFAERVRRFPALSPHAVTQGLSADDGRRGLTLLAAAMLKPGLGSRVSGLEEGGEQGELFWEDGEERGDEGGDTDGHGRARMRGLGRLNPDWLELMLGLPLGWTRETALDAGEFAAWEAGWMRLEGWGHGPGVWMGYRGGTLDLPGAVGMWERSVPRATLNPHDFARARVLGGAVSPVVMAAALGFLMRG